MLYTKSGMLIAKNYERIVTNDYGGKYYEISKENIIIKNIHIPESKRWKLKNQHKIDYIEYRTNADSVKIYYQVRDVDYADYKIGFFYISINKIELKKNKVRILDFL